MTNYIEINNAKYAIIDRTEYAEPGWDNRACMHITLNIDYETAKTLFVDNLQWKFIYQAQIEEYDDEGLNNQPSNFKEEIYDWSHYCKAGKIIDNRDGSLTIWMGCLTDAELAVQEALKNAGFISEAEAAAAYYEGVNSL